MRRSESPGEGGEDGMGIHIASPGLQVGVIFEPGVAERAQKFVSNSDLHVPAQRIFHAGQALKRKREIGVPVVNAKVESANRLMMSQVQSAGNSTRARP